MKTYQLIRRQEIKKPQDEVFRFFESPDNLERITPIDVGFQLLTPSPIVMQTGTVLDYIVRLLGIPVRWTSLISHYDPPHRFSDVALRGPYRFWHHTHTFEKTTQGTLMTDVVKYSLPFGFLGNIVHSLWVRHQLECIFDYRARIIGQILESGNVSQEDSRGDSLESKGRQ